MLAATALMTEGAAAGHAAGSSSPGTVPRPHRPWVGAEIDWDVDTAASFDAEAGAQVSLVGRTFAYPLSPAGVHELADESQQSAAAGAVAVVTLDPTTLVHLTPDDADALARDLAYDARRDGSRFLVRFAPDMNSSAVAWGLLPRTYVGAFQTVADAVHDDAGSSAAMVWSPAYGAGYPGPHRAPASALPYLDTDHDHRVTDADDPYAPYYPGDAFVDWVGLDVPAGGSLDQHLLERAGYAVVRHRPTFYVTYAGTKHKPLLLTTAQDDGAWLRQVLGAAATRPELRGLLLTSPAPGALGAGLQGAATTLAPVLAARSPTVRQPAVTSRAPAARETSHGGGFPAFLAGLLTMLAIVVVAGVAALVVRRRRAVPEWLR